MVTVTNLTLFYIYNYVLCIKEQPREVSFFLGGCLIRSVMEALSIFR